MKIGMNQIREGLQKRGRNSTRVYGIFMMLVLGISLLVSDTYGQADPDRTDLEEAALVDDTAPAETEEEEAAFENAVTMIIPFAGMATAITILWIIFSAILKSEKMKQESIKQFLEKGKDVPRELLVDAGNPGTWPQKPTNDLRRSVIWLSVGIGMALFAWLISNNIRGMALGIPFIMVGLGYLILSKTCPQPEDSVNQKLPASKVDDEE